MCFIASICTEDNLNLAPPSVPNLFLAFVAGAETVQGGEAAVQRRSRDAESAAAPQHRAILRLLGIAAEGEEVHRSGYGAHDLRDAENVGPFFNTGSLSTFNLSPLDALVAFYINHNWLVPLQ